MKTTIKFASLALLYSLAISCTTQSTTLDADLCIINDITDKMTVYPTAEEIISQLGLQDNPWQNIRITLTFASDRDINDVKVVTLDAENQWAGNLPLRKAKIQHFEKQLQQCLSTMKYTAPCPYSIIYRTVTRQANRLAASTATKRYLLIYSDLVEHDTDVNFYNPRTVARLQKTPERIAQQLEATVPLHQLNGLQVWFIYNPTSFAQNNSYMSIAEFYRHVFIAHGATTHLANKFVPL